MLLSTPAVKYSDYITSEWEKPSVAWHVSYHIYL